ncbi:hypothetical protein F4X90_00220 [Candidatus Poribacteria bacterium]|nr:hypothetical protein [Candidatus Poribacteria bacterium]
MKRRDFLIGSIGALATGVTGCAGISQVIAPSWPNVTPLEMDRFLIASDAAMNRIVENPDGGHAISKLQQKPMGKKDAQLFRQSMRSLLLVGNFGDLSVAGQVHPGMQKRLHYSAPEMDAAVQGTVNQMKSLSPTARADIQSALRENPTLGDQTLEAMDLEAAAVGASNRRRKQLHVIGQHIIDRLKHSSDMFINEYVAKCEKLTVVSGSAAETQRFMAARIGQAAFKARLKEAENAARYWQRQDLEDIPIGYQLVTNEGINDENSPDDASQEQREPQQLPKTENIARQSGSEPSDGWYRTGLFMLGISGVVFVGGLGLIAIGGGDMDTGVGHVGALITIGAVLFGMFSCCIILLGGIIDIFDGP